MAQMSSEAASPPTGGTGAEGQGGGDAAGQVKEKVQETADQAQQKAQEAAGQAKATLRDQLGERSNQAGDRLSSQAQDIRTVGEELRKQGKDQPAKVADQAAERLERVGGYLSESDPDRIVSDVEDYARRNPWTVMAGGMVLGALAARFLKASSVERRRPGAGHEAPASEERFTRPQVGPPAPTPATRAPAPAAPPPSAHPVPPTGGPTGGL